MPSRLRAGLGIVLCSLLFWGLPPEATLVRAFQPSLLDSVVSVLPLWPGMERGGRPEIPPGTAPEGTAVALFPGGYLVTALHVVDKSLEVTVRLADGRELPAEIVGQDRPTDLALLKVAVDLPVLEASPEIGIAAPVCAIGNQFGLGLSVSCGVVSAVQRSGTGFNPIEDFIQTDAAVNPGSSGGALVDSEGRLVGMLSAIFAGDSDANIGVNFAVSLPLIMRVAEDLKASKRVSRGRTGLNMGELGPEQRKKGAGVWVRGVHEDGAAQAAGVRKGDIITGIDGRRIGKISDAVAAFQLKRPGDRLSVDIRRGEETLTLDLWLTP